MWCAAPAPFDLAGNVPGRDGDASDKRQRPSGLEYCVRFLEADPWCFRSGYAKERIIPAIVQFDLDESIRHRLARVVLAAVDDPRPRREIRRYGNLARHVAAPELRRQLKTRTEAADPQVRLNARWVVEELG